MMHMDKCRHKRYLFFQSTRHCFLLASVWLSFSEYILAWVFILHLSPSDQYCFPLFPHTLANSVWYDSRLVRNDSRPLEVLLARSEGKNAGTSLLRALGAAKNDKDYVTSQKILVHCHWWRIHSTPAWPPDGSPIWSSGAFITLLGVRDFVELILPSSCP